MTSIAEAEKMVEQYIAKDDICAAVKLLYEMVVKCAKAKRFSEAETLRDRIMEVDSMALNEIISSAEIIEEEKSQSLDPVHMELWSRLYSTLDMDEKNALFFGLKDAQYEINQTVYSQGDLNSNLYFIHNGKLNVIYAHRDGEILLSTLGSGDIAGQDNFFSNTVCTTSLQTATNVNVKFLEKKVLTEWKESYPNLEHKLNNFCLGTQNVTDLLQRKELDRRTQKRVKITGMGIINLLNRAGQPIAKSFKGELKDISVGGLSFEIRISKEETARLLLGRRLNIEFSFTKSVPNIHIHQNGLIVGVYPYPFEDYSIHVKFDKMLDRNAIASIQRCSPGK
jgi:CRP-like cAMP-binding protein